MLSIVAIGRGRTWDMSHRGEGNAVLAMSQFPHSLSVSQQHKCGEEPEAHASGACLLQAGVLTQMGEQKGDAQLGSMISEASTVNPHDSVLRRAPWSAETERTIATTMAVISRPIQPPFNKATKHQRVNLAQQRSQKEPL